MGNTVYLSMLRFLFN